LDIFDYDFDIDSIIKELEQHFYWKNCWLSSEIYQGQF